MKNLLSSSLSVCGLLVCIEAAAQAQAQAPAKAAPPATPAKQETAPKAAATPPAGSAAAAKPTAKLPTGPTSKAEQAGMWAQYRPGDPNGKTPPAKTAGSQAPAAAKK